MHMIKIKKDITHAFDHCTYKKQCKYAPLRRSNNGLVVFEDKHYFTKTISTMIAIQGKA